MSSPVRYLVSACLPVHQRTVLAIVSVLVFVLGVAPAGGATELLMTLAGAAVGDNFGGTVSSGDVNGDGYADVIVGACLSDPGQAGRVYIYLGGPGADDIPDVILAGAAPDEWFGTSVASVGDVNGDGIDDLLIGAVRSSGGGIYQSGSAYLFFGGATIRMSPDLALRGAEDSERFGTSVSTAGDVNGDGFSDFIIGAARNDTGGHDAGGAYVYYGGPIVDSQADWILSGTVPDGLFGAAVSGGGDINGDGYSDVVVGAFGEGGTGRAYVFYGWAEPDQVPDLIMSGESYADTFGSAVATGGDVNADGYADVAIGAKQNAAGGAGAGRTYVYFGGPGADNTSDLVTTGAAKECLGTSLACTGDLNGDGVVDLAIGGSPSIVGSDSGRVWVYLGGSNVDSKADLVLNRNPDMDFFGTSMALNGDVSGDGIADLVVGAPGRDASGGIGHAFVFGRRPTIPSVELDIDPDVVDLASHGRWVTAYIEPRSLSATNIDLVTIRLAELIPADPKFGTVADHDNDGWPDLMVKFSRQSLTPLLAVGTNQLSVNGRFVGGQEFEGKAEVQVIDTSAGKMSASIVPNPLKPSGELRFKTTAVGQVSVRMFDLRGRLVRSLIEAQVMPAGTHSARIDGRSRGGEELPTGIYFYRIETSSGPETGRFMIVK